MGLQSHNRTQIFTFHFVLSSPVISNFSQIFNHDRDLRVNEKWSYSWQRKYEKIPTAPCMTVSSRSLITHQPHTQCLSQPIGQSCTEIPANHMQWPFITHPIRSFAWRVLTFQVKQICLPWSWVVLIRFWINRPTCLSKIYCCVICYRIQHLKWLINRMLIKSNQIITCSFFQVLYKITHTVPTGIHNAYSCYDQIQIVRIYGCTVVSELFS